MDNRVAITGIGLISPLGDSSGAVFKALCNGQSGVHETEPVDLNGSQCHLACQLLDFRPERYLSGRPLRPLDRASQLASAACGLALENSGWSAESRATFDLALVVGTMFGGMHTIGDFDRTALISGAASVSPMAFANTVINAPAGQTAIWHNLRGANSTVATGSISGISAVGHGADLIRSGRSKALVAGGVDEFSVESFRGFDLAGLLCSNGVCPECPVPFDQRRNGFALGEGSGFVVLEELTYASARGARILAEVKGYASAFDYAQGNDPDQAVRTLVRTMHTAMNRSGMTQRDIDFVSASGNGSRAKDLHELTSLATVFGGRAKELPVTAIKCAIAEALGGSGPAQIAAAIETLHNQTLPGIIGLQELAPACPLQSLSSKTQTIKARNALINGVGLDGNCCSIIIAIFDE